MDNMTATEIAYKNGYEDGQKTAQPTWIPVTERLPMYNDRVLAYVCGRIEPLTLFYRDLLVEDYWEDDVQRVIILGAVTHWMPMPMPPKGGMNDWNI